MIDKAMSPETTNMEPQYFDVEIDVLWTDRDFERLDRVMIQEKLRCS